MKTLILILMILILMPVIFAQTEDQAVQQIAGISPDSFFYFLDISFDNLGVSFASGITREKIRLRIADERLAEYKVMINKNNINAAEIAEQNRKNEIDSLELESETLNDNEKKDVQEMLQKHIIVLEKIKEKVPEQAKKGIENAIISSSKVFDNIQEKISEEKRETQDTIRQNIIETEKTVKIFIPETETSRLQCQNAGGEWRLFNEGCVDSCIDKSKISCTMAITEGCDCGPVKCYENLKCIDNLYPTPIEVKPIPQEPSQPGCEGVKNCIPCETDDVCPINYFCDKQLKRCLGYTGLIEKPSLFSVYGVE
mgnify:CR=1 FL=1